MTDTAPNFLREEKLDLSSLASDEGIALARALAEEYVAVVAEITDLEEKLKASRARKLELEQREIPDLFGQLATDKIGVPAANCDVVVKPYYKANIAADWEAERREAAFSWLERNGHGSLIAVEVAVAFSRGEIEQARELEQLIRTTFPGANEHPVNLSMSVPWGTLTAFIKEQTEAEKTLPLELLGATVGQTAKIQKRKN